MQNILAAQKLELPRYFTESISVVIFTIICKIPLLTRPGLAAPVHRPECSRTGAGRSARQEQMSLQQVGGVVSGG